MAKRLRVPRPIRWVLVLLGLAAGWAAGDLLDAKTAAPGTTSPRLPGADPPAGTRPAATAPAGPAA